MLFGAEWLEQQYRLCMEGKYLDASILMQVVPLARTPMDKKGGRAMQKYYKDVNKSLRRSLIPWEERRADAMRRAAKYGGKVKPGEVTVILGPGEGGLSDIFKDSKIAKA